MGYKNLCIPCKKAFIQGTDFTRIRASNCPDCGERMIQMNHRFRPPKISEKSKWRTVEFLINKGFFYQHIYDDEIARTYVNYPENLRDAKEFSVKYKDQALNSEQIERIMGEII